MSELKQETKERVNDCAKLKVSVPVKSPKSSFFLSISFLDYLKQQITDL